MSAYSQAMKLMFDQLTSLGSTTTEKQLVMQILTGLNDQYENIALILQQTVPLPDFYNTRSRLCQVEERKTAQAKVSAQAAGTALTTTPDTSNRITNNNRDRSRGDTYDRRGDTYDRRGRGRGRGRRGRGSYSRGRFNSSDNYYSGAPWHAPPWGDPHTSCNQWPTTPPCPYPSAQNQQPQTPNLAQGILGPRPSTSGSGNNNPAHSYNTGYSPTDIAEALYNLALQHNDSSWTMDTGASDTMSPHQTMFSSIFNSIIRNIIVGDGKTIPVLGQGDITLPPPFPPFKLKNVLYAPNLVKNLISVRRFTTDNQLSVEFDPYGFTVKDLRTKKPIHGAIARGISTLSARPTSHTFLLLLLLLLFPKTSGINGSVIQGPLFYKL
ncbi:putative RNA-directed DNA polymerase [Helianthus annuus]|nr:putative RNA-directed DNA polymerase [Helianthus annuus]